MSGSIEVGFIVLGVLLIAGSRVIADGFKVPSDSSAVTKFAGLGDNYPSRLYRWIVAVVSGIAFVAVGVAGLLGG
jgi:hypothetical protein